MTHLSAEKEMALGPFPVCEPSSLVFWLLCLAFELLKIPRPVYHQHCLALTTVSGHLAFFGLLLNKAEVVFTE